MSLSLCLSHRVAPTTQNRFFSLVPNGSKIFNALFGFLVQESLRARITSTGAFHFRGAQLRRRFGGESTHLATPLCRMS